MMTSNGTNVLELTNERGTLHIEREQDLGVVITIDNPTIALKMTGLYQLEELQYVVNHSRYARIKHGYFSPSIGSKKVLETIFTSQGANGEIDYSITFLSDDTTYHYRINQREWNEILALFSYLVDVH